MNLKALKYIVFALVLLIFVGHGQAVTENTDMGWLEVINHTYTSETSIENAFIGVLNGTPSLNQTVYLDPQKGIVWNISSPSNRGNLFLGQLYPGGQTRYRINISLVNTSGVNTQAQLYIGTLGRVIFTQAASGTSTSVVNQFYNSTGVVNNTLIYYTGKPFADTYIDIYPNGSITVTDANNAASTYTTKYRLDYAYPYNYISPNMLQLSYGVLGSANISIRTFSQSIPKKLITVKPRNDTFAFGFDSRVNASYGIDYLNGLGYKPTFWWDRTFHYGTQYNASTKSQFVNYITSGDVELGIHFSQALATLSLSDANDLVASEILNLTNTTGMSAKSWSSLQNNDNATHAQNIWRNYSILWRNAPQSATAYGAIGNIQEVGTAGDYSASTIPFWSAASQRKIFYPAFTHGVLTPGLALEGFDITYGNFTQIISNYSNDSITIQPYAQWYEENNNTVTDITSVNFNLVSSQFSINTKGYNATATVYDANSSGNSVWYAASGWVKTSVSTSNETNITINTPSTQVVKKANASIVPTSYNNFSINITTWDTSGNYRKVFTLSSSASIIAGDLVPNTDYVVNKNNVLYNVYKSNASGYISFSDTITSETQYRISSATAQDAYTTSTCQSTLNWGVVGSALVIILIIIGAGTLAIGFLTGVKFDTIPIEQFVLALIGVVVVGSIGVAIINPIIILIGCP